MVNFPSSLDSLSNPGATTRRNDPGFELDVVISTLNDIAEAVEGKLGIGASTPADGYEIAGTGVSTSTWRLKDLCRAHLAAATQSTSSGVAAAIQFDAELFDTHGMHDVATNKSRFVAPVAGKYLFTAQVAFGGSGLGTYRLVYLQRTAAIGGATTILRESQPHFGSSLVIVPISDIIDLAVNDYVEVFAQQDAGVLALTGGTVYYTCCAVARLL